MIEALKRFFLWVLGLSLAHEAWATNWIYPGIYTKAAAGAGQTQSRGVDALVHNPANLIITGKNDLYCEINPLFLNYRYIPLQQKYEVTDMKVFIPPTYLGYSGKKPEQSFAFGFMVDSLATPEPLTIKNAPIEVGDAIEVMDVALATNGFNFTAGAAFTIKKRAVVGISLLASQEEIEVRGFRNHEEILTKTDKATSVGTRLGLRSKLGSGRRTLLGISFQPQIVKYYRGSISLAGVATGSSQIGYLPPIAAIGLEFRDRSRLRYFGEFSRHFYSRGRGIKKGGFENDPPTTDYRDSNFLALGISGPVRKGEIYTLAFSYQDGNLGNGLKGKNLDGFDEVLVSGGGVLGDFESIPRKNIATGYSILFPKVGLNFMASYAWGNRIVPAGSTGEGGYILNTYMVGIGGNYHL